MRLDPTMSPRDDWTVLREKGYLIQLWPINESIYEEVKAYVKAISKLGKRLNNPKISPLAAGEDVHLDDNLVRDLDGLCKAASKILVTVRQETADLMSELNDIEAEKMISQQAPVEEGDDA